MKFFSFLAISLTILASIFLFRMKHEVLMLEHSMDYFSQNIHRLEQEIYTLNSEISYLTNPSRIQDLAQRYLPNGKPLQLDQLLPFPVQ